VKLGTKMQLPYSVDDDEAAFEAVGHEINRPDPVRWRAMTKEDDRVRQTYRVLGQLIKRTQVSLLRKKKDLRIVRLPRHEYWSAAAEYEEWKARAVHFLGCLEQRRSELRDRVRQFGQQNALDRLTADLQAFASAVTAHRTAIRGDGERPETTADRLLWARLDLLASVNLPSLIRR
jgi:hypothetical protein